MANLKTHIATSDATTIRVRGHDLVQGLIGHKSFTEMLYLVTVERFPTDAEAQLLDACLVTLMEHGFTPTSLITRLTIDSVPDQVQVAMASGLLAVGAVFIGTMEGCAKILRSGIEEGGDLKLYCKRVVEDHLTKRAPLPGFGHPFHKPDDPRTFRLFEVARELKLDGRYVGLLRQLSNELDLATGKHLTINATGAIAALLLEIGVPPEIMRAIAVVSRCGGLAGHIIEERRTHSARYIWQLAEQNILYEDPTAS